MKKLLFILLFLPSLSISQIWSGAGMNMNLLGTYSWDSPTEGSDIWGWVDANGNEFALVGLTDGFSVVNVTVPSNPTQEFYIPDINSIWRDIKTWGNYAYVTTEADAGLLIVDLTDMTGNTFWHVSSFNHPTNGSSIEFTAAHNIYIDENGIAYIFGASSNTGSSPADGAIFLDVASNPTAPEYLGEWDDEYIHDGMVRGDTMWAGCIYAGKVFAVDVSNKSNPTTIGSHSTPNNFTHNAWISDDGDFVFTTDETSGAYLTAYNVSDINNIYEVDRIQSNPGSNSIPHNTHVDGNFLITSYYRDGTTVHDITYPNNMIQVAYYDSYVGSGNGFDGCWGTYPFLPSGNIISSDRNSGPSGNAMLWVYGRDFQQASFISGTVTDGVTGASISSASIEIVNSSYNTTTNLLGNYTLGSVDSGSFQVLFSAIGYTSVTLNVSLTSGVMTSLDAVLYDIFTTPGCTDSSAINYDPTATVDDGSCIYNNGSCTDLFFSEYVEGYGQNKALEIYNPTQNIIDLSNYTIERYANGATTNGGGISYLSGFILPGDVFVVTNGETDTLSQWGFCDPILYAMGDFAEPNGSYPTPLHFNGNDVLVLTKNGIIIDVIGRIGEDPAGGAWTADSASGFQLGTWWTANHTLIRKNSILQGDQNGLDLFNPSLEWDSLPVGTYSNLGYHNSICTPGIIYGCTDSLAINFDPTATVDDGNCIYFSCIDSSLIDSTANCVMIWDPVCGCDSITYANDCVAINYGGVTSFTSGVCSNFYVYGCTDSLACNYDPNAAQDDGSCIYIDNPVVDLTTGQWIMEGNFGCDSILEGVWYINYSSDGTLIYDSDTSFSFPYTGVWSLCDSNYTDTDSITSYWYTGSYTNGMFNGIMSNGCWVMYQNLGCTDPLALNYNTFITIDDGSCLYPISFCDNFESYQAGDPIAETSPNWNTWGELMSGWTAPFSDDVDVANTNALSGSNSLYFIDATGNGGPQDIVLMFDSNALLTTPYVSGNLNFSQMMYIVPGKTGYFNFQAENTPGITWALEVNFDVNGNILMTNLNGTSFSALYPIGQWFEIKFEIDLTTNNWEVFVDGQSQGSFSNSINQISSLDLYPAPFSEYWVDDVCYSYSPTIPSAIYGCTDIIACNYDSTATIDDSSCIYISNPAVDMTIGTWTLVSSDNCDTTYNTLPTHSFSSDGTWGVGIIPPGIGTWSMCGSTMIYEWGSGIFTGTYNAGSGTIIGVGSGSWTFCGYLIPDSSIYGCTDSTAINFDPSATIDDGSCQYIFSCTPDPQYTLPGIYPDSATGTSPAYVGQSYNEIFTVITPIDSVIDFGLGPVLATIDSIVVTSINGLPPGFTYSCNNSNCSFSGGSSSCLSIYSYQNPTLSDIGIYPLYVNTTTYFSNIPFLGNYTTTGFIDDYYIEILGGSSYGCTDPGAINYDSTATVDDGSCYYPNSSTPIWCDDFSNPSNWVIDHDPTACSLDWQIGNYSCTGSYPIDDILSTTASNGYAMIDSDSYGGATGGIEMEDSWLTMANPVDLNGYPYVVVEFETQYRRYNNENAYLVVGIGDGSGNVVWPDLEASTNISNMNNVFEVFPGWNTNESTTNPQLMSINISSALVGLTSTELADIYIRFHWTGTWGYAWYVDDVCISPIPDNGVAIQDEVYGGWWIAYQTAGGLGQDYTYNPISQATANPYSFEAVIKNTGLATQAVTMHTFVSGPSTSSHVSNTISLAMSEQDTFVATPTFTPTSNGVYTIDMWGVGDSAGLGVILTNTDTTTKTTEVTDYVYGKDNNSYDSYWRLSRTGQTAGGFEVGADYDIYTNSDLYSIDVFIADWSIPGTQVYATLYEIDPVDPWMEPIFLDQSDDYTLQSGDPGTWINIPFLSPASLMQGVRYCITIGGYMHPVDSAGVGISGTGTYSLDRLFDKDDWYQNGMPTWYTIGNIPMLRMNFDPATQATYGCTDPLADNYDPSATIDDGSCIYCSSISSNLIIGDVSCNGANDGSASVSPTGGSGSFHVSWWDPAISTYNVTGLIPASGVYWVQVLDLVTGCFVFNAFDISEPAQVTTGLQTFDPICYGSNDGYATVTPNGVSGANFTVYWNGIPSSTVYSQLQPGTYFVEVINTLTGCSSGTEIFTINEPAPITVNLTGTDVSSTGACDGSITAAPSGGCAPYTYQWDNGQTTSNLSGLCPGTYCLTITDCNGCMEFSCVTISEPCSITAFISSNVPSDSVSCDGFAVAMPSPNIPPYTYLWTDTSGTVISNSDLASSLCNSVYFISVTDSFGCVYTDTLVLGTIYGCTDPSALNYDYFANTDDGSCTYPPILGCTDSTALNYNSNANTDDGSCLYCDIDVDLFVVDPSSSGACDGWIYAAGSSSYPPIQYLWNTGQTFNFINLLCSGVYTVTLTDAMGCSLDTTIILGTVTFGCTDSLACNYDQSATIDDGSCEYTSCVGCTDPLADNYDSAATIDDGSCIYCTTLTATATSTNVTCCGASNGSATVIITGGQGPYTLNWTGPMNFSNNGVWSQSIATGLLPGTYICLVTDFNGCTYSISVTITEPDCLQATTSFNSPSCNGMCDGSASVSPTGGVAPYTYMWSDGQTTQTATNLCAGTYTCNVLDSFCSSYVISVTITEPGIICGCTDSLATNYDPTATVDDGSCTYTNNCTDPMPTGLNVTDVVHDRATINWDNMNDTNCTVDQYRIKYREVGANSWSQKNMGTPLGSCTWPCNKTDKLILGLTAGTTYEYQMRAWYCGGGNSSWTALYNFTTLPDCPNIGNLAVSSGSPTQATFTWDDSNGPYSFVRLKYRVDTIANPSGSDWGNIGGAGVVYPTFTKNKNNLTPGETYRAQARTWCDPNGGPYKSDTWTSLVYWTQPTNRVEGGESITHLDVYPNPSRDVFNISFTSEKIQNLKVRILNVIGEELIEDDMQQFVGEYVKAIDLKEYSKGIYFLEIETDNGVINKKLILQ